MDMMMEKKRGCKANKKTKTSEKYAPEISSLSDSETSRIRAPRQQNQKHKYSPLMFSSSESTFEKGEVSRPSLLGELRIKRERVF